MEINGSYLARALAFASAQLAITAGSAFLPAPAHAGPVEVLADITVHPSDSHKIVLGYDNGFGGLLVSGDGGHSFRLRPSESVHTLLPDTYFPRDNVPILLTPDALLVGGTGGLLTGDAETCGLAQGSTLLADPVLALTPHPNNPDEAFLVSTKTKAAHGGLFRRKKMGELTQLGPDDPTTVIISGLKAVTREASSEHLRFVETGARVTPGAAQAAQFVRYSDDLGATWTEHALTLPGNGSVKLLAVDPLDPDRLLIMGRTDPVTTDAGLSLDPADDLLLSVDAGKNFSSYSSSVMTARYATFAPDGRFWLGDVAGGLYFAKRLGDALSKVADVKVYGLWFDKSSDELLVAQAYELGRLKTADYSYCQMFRIYETLAYPTCSNENIATDSATKFQVCTAFCNATHYWYAPVCKNYNDVAGACGLGVLGSDFETQLPNTMDEPKRCDGFILNYADPTSSAADAGTSPRDAGGLGGATVDAGSTAPIADAAAPASNGDAMASAGEPAAPRGSSKGGCSCSVSATNAPDRLWLSAALLLLGWSFVRRTVGRRRIRVGVRAGISAVTLLALLGGAGCDGNGQDEKQEDSGAAQADADEADAPSIATTAVCPASVADSPVSIDSAGTSGKLRAKVLSADHDPARKYLNTWTVELRDALGQPIDDAQFENARTYMPVHGHDGQFPPTITRDASAPGQYTFKDLNFIMTGPWQVQFDVSSDSAGKDQFNLDVCVGD